MSKGSVATHLRYGAIFSDSVITTFFLILTVKKFEHRSIFDEVKAYEAYKKVCQFLGHPV